MTRPAGPPDILAFSHIPKTAGTTLHTLLQGHFGCGHMAVRHRSPTVVYGPSDLAFDLKLMPWARSIAGHSLKPFQHFGAYEDRLAWYTFLRDPIERFISHYQHQYTGGREAYRLPFREWMETHFRQNWMVRMLAGEEDLAAALQILEEKVTFVGLVERFDESLLLFRDHFQLDGFQVDYPAPVNRAPSNAVRARIAEEWEEHEERVRQENSLDVDLYDHVVRNIWTAQVRTYGPERLREDMGDSFQGRPARLTARVRRGCYRLHRHLVYKPVVRLHRGWLAQQ